MESLIEKLKKGRTGDKVFAARELSLNWTRKKTGNENIKWEDVEKWKRIGFAKPKALDISHARISDLVVEVKEELKTGNEHHFEREIKANSDLLIKTNDLGWMIKYLSGISYKSADFDGVSKAEYLAQRFYSMIRWHKAVETNAYRELMREFEDGNTGILEKALIFINKCVENEFELARSADGDLDIVVKPPKKSEKLFSDISKDPFIQEAYASLILSMPNATQWKQELVQYIWIGIERIVKEQIRDYENPANEARVTREFASWLVFFSRAMERTIEEIDEGRVPVKRRYDVGKRVIERLIGEAIELSGGDDNGSGTPPASPGPENSARPVMPEGDVEANGLSGFETLIEKGFRALRANPFDPNTNAISPVAIAAMDRSTGEYTQPPRRRSGQFTPFRDLPLFKGKLTRKDAIDLLVQIVDERFDGDVSKMRSADGFALMRFFRCEDGNPISGLTLIKIVIPEIGIRYEKSKNNGNFHVAKAILRNAIIEVRQLVEKAKASNKPRKKFDLIENAKKKKGGPDSGGKTPPASGGAKTATEKSLAASDKIEKIYAEVEEVERQVVELLSEATSRMGSITKEMYESDGCQDELADIAVLTGSAMTIYEKYTQRLDQVEMENSAEKGIRYWEIRSRLHSIGNILNRVMSTPKDIISFHRKGEDYSFVEAILKEPLPSIEAHKKSHKFEMYGFLADNYNVKIKFVGSGEKILEAMPSWLKYIIENLIINTASKTPDGEQAKLFIDYNPETRTFAFTNSMPPIPKEIHIKMGREVMNGDFEKEGPGKGLFVNFNMAKLHGGKMWVDRGQEANPEKGITEKRPTFYIQLPSEDIEPESGDGGGTLPVAGSTTTPPVSAGFLRKAADNVLGSFLSEDRINDPHEAVYEKYGVRVTNKNNRVTVVTPNGTWHTGRRDDGRFHNNFPEELTRLSGLRGKKILDIGTGGGTLVTRLRKKGIDIEGLDMWLNEYQRRQKHFIEALAHDIPRPDETYDIVHVQEAMFRDSAEKSGHEENVATLREIKRVLKVGGRLRVAPVNVELLTGLVAEVGGLKILKPAKSVSTTAKPLYLEIEKMSNDEANSPDSGTTPPVSKDSSPKTGPVQGSLPAFFPQAFTTTLTAPGEGLFARPSLLVNGGINARGLSPRFDAKPRDDGWVDFEVGNGFADNSEVNVEYDATYRPGKTSGVMAAE